MSTLDEPQSDSSESPGRRKRILFVIPTLDQSGAEKQLTLLATHLPREQYDLDVVTLTRGGFYQRHLEAAGIPATVLGKRLKLDPGTLWKLRRLIRERKPDLIHSWLFAANAYVRLVSGSNGPPIVVSERCVDTWKSGWQLWLDRRLINRTARLVGNAKAVADFYQTVGYSSGQLRVISNGIDLPQALEADVRSRLREELAIPDGDRIVGYIGRFAPQKRLLDLIWAAQLLQQLNSPVTFLFVGDGPERTAMEELLEQFDVKPMVRLTGHREDATEIMQLLDVFWLGSDFEGQSNSVMEAMAAGVPVVCSDIPANRELVVDGQTGFLVKPGDSVGFAQFADRILADSELAKRLGDAGRQRIADSFSLETMVNSFCHLYESVLGNRC